MINVRLKAAALILIVAWLVGCEPPPKKAVTPAGNNSNGAAPSPASPTPQTTSATTPTAPASARMDSNITSSNAATSATPSPDIAKLKSWGMQGSMAFKAKEPVTNDDVTTARFTSVAKGIPPEEISILLKFPNLQRLVLNGKKLPDEAFDVIAKLPNLESLDIAESQFTGEGLTRLVPLAKLRTLELHSTGLTDEHVDLLAEMKQLKTLGLLGTFISQSGFDKLRAALPDCKIDWYLKE